MNEKNNTPQFGVEMKESSTNVVFSDDDSIKKNKHTPHEIKIDNVDPRKSSLDVDVTKL